MNPESAGSVSGKEWTELSEGRDKEREGEHTELDEVPDSAHDYRAVC